MKKFNRKSMIFLNFREKSEIFWAKTIGFGPLDETEGLGLTPKINDFWG